MNNKKKNFKIYAVMDGMGVDDAITYCRQFLYNKISIGNMRKKITDIRVQVMNDFEQHFQLDCDKFINSLKERIDLYAKSNYITILVPCNELVISSLVKLGYMVDVCIPALNNHDDVDMWFNELLNEGMYPISASSLVANYLKLMNTPEAKAYLSFEGIEERYRLRKFPRRIPEDLFAREATMTMSTTKDEYFKTRKINVLE